MIIAAIAYRDLSAEDKAKVTSILKHHPEYSKWKKGYRSGTPNLDLATYIFMKASLWPDEIRRSGNQFDHPNWHFINYPLEAPSFPLKPGPFPDDDVLFGISECIEVLDDDTQTLSQKAVYLSWLIHLTGDIHQPLHCSALINDTYHPPKGDKGGNDFYVKPNTAGVKLHAVWDHGLGSTVNPRDQLNDAISLGASFARSALPELQANDAPEEWSKESRALAIEKGYLNGQLHGSKTKTNAPKLPSGYTAEVKSVSEKQAARAGYRLADLVRDHVN